MRLYQVGFVLTLMASVLLAENTEQIADKEQEDGEYEDIAVAESKDVAHSLNPNEDVDYPTDHRRPSRGRKRRRRMRKRPRSTTPSPFIEEYDPERTAKEDEVEDEVIYQRRRPTKRRRRPVPRLPVEYDNDTPVELDVELPNEQPQEFRPRGSQRRRRRKGGRKRPRVTTEPTEINNNTRDESDNPEVTSQTPEVVVQSNNNYPHERETLTDLSVPNREQEETTAISTFASAFTTKEITEINHKLEPLSEYQPPETDYQVPGLEGFSIHHPTRSDLTTQNPEENHIVSSSTTTKEYSWAKNLNLQSEIRTTTEEITTLRDARMDEEKTSDVTKEPQHRIKNIDKIIENRKNLFSKSRRLPATSAVIRRRLVQPRIKHKNVTTTQETITDNTIPTVNPSKFKTEGNNCQNTECDSSPAVLSNNIFPSALLPSGFPTMPEILSTAELIKKVSEIVSNKEDNITSQHDHTETEVPNHPSHPSSNLIIITPSTLIRSNNEENTLSEYPEHKNSEIRILSEVKEDQTDVSNTSIEETTTPSTTTVNTDKAGRTTLHSIQSSNTKKEEMKVTTTTEEATSESDKFKLDNVDVSNINDEILELIMDEMGKARVKRILELRNMTLSELIAHRERGAGRFSALTEEHNKKNITQEGNKQFETKIEKKKDSTDYNDNNDEEQTEQLIVDKAKHFLNEYKRSEEPFSKVVVKSSQSEKVEFGQKLKLEGTVIPVPILEPTHTAAIQFPEDKVMGEFPKYMYKIAGNQPKPASNEKHSLFTESINKPRGIQNSENPREPRVFESMPVFSSEVTNKANLEISPYPDWRITVSKSSTEKSVGFPGISREIMLVATSTRKSVANEEVILLDEGEEAHHLRNHMLGGNINIESRDLADEDYSEEKKVPAGVKSAIAASGALLGLAIFGFLAVLVSCKIRQRRARLRVRRDILTERLAEDFRSSQRSLTPVLRKSPFNHNIHSNTASNRHYYLWRTLRKTFQYE